LRISVPWGDTPVWPSAAPGSTDSITLSWACSVRRA